MSRITSQTEVVWVAKYYKSTGMSIGDVFVDESVDCYSQEEATQMAAQDLAKMIADSNYTEDYFAIIQQMVVPIYK